MDFWIIIFLVGLALLGAPLFAIFGAAAMLLFAQMPDTPITGATNDVFSEKFANSPLLVTIPLFTFVGYVLARAKTAARLVRFSTALVGWIPGGLAIVFPVIIGFSPLGTAGLAGMLVGAIATGVMLGIQTANSGGAMDNAKKYIEEGHFGGKGSDAHKAAVVGDTVGDPLKDTVGPSINILIKLMCVIALVLAPIFAG